VTSETSVPATANTTVSRPALTAITRPRAGTAAKVVRIRPVPYSGEMASTPRTPKANCTMAVP